MAFTIIATFIIVFFYSVYFIKMFVQKRRGIQTNQIGTREGKKLKIVETLMSISTAFAAPVQVISIATNWNLLPNIPRIVGCCIGLAGDVVFLLAVLTMKDNWRAGIPKNATTKLVQRGIFSYSRNPAFLGFDLMYIGVCLIFFNPLSLVFSMFPIIMLHFQILQEEPYLKNTFGIEYINYKNKVSRYIGRR